MFNRFFWASIIITALCSVSGTSASDDPLIRDITRVKGRMTTLQSSMCPLHPKCKLLPIPDGTVIEHEWQCHPTPCAASGAAWAEMRGLVAEDIELSKSSGLMTKKLEEEAYLRRLAILKAEADLRAAGVTLPSRK